MLGERRGQLLWLGDGVYAVSLYVDGYRTISSALASLALMQAGPSAERDAPAPPMQRRESCHPATVARTTSNTQRATPSSLPRSTVGMCQRGRMALGRQPVDRRDMLPGALTTGYRRRIPVGDGSIASTPNSRVVPGGGGPIRTLQGPRGELPGYPGVGLNSFGPNPTANPVGAEEGGRWRARTATLLGEADVRPGARSPG